MPTHSYSRQSWTRAERLTLKMTVAGVDRSYNATWTDNHGRPWSQAQIDLAVKNGRMKITQERKTRNVQGRIMARTLSVRIRPIVRQRQRAAA